MITAKQKQRGEHDAEPRGGCLDEPADALLRGPEAVELPFARVGGERLHAAARERLGEDEQQVVDEPRDAERRALALVARKLARRDEALRYAIAKALRRGLRRLPRELLPWAPAGVFESTPDPDQAKTSRSDPRLV